MSEYKPGDRLRITIDVELSNSHVQPPAVDHFNAFTDEHFLRIPLGPSVTVERLDAVPEPAPFIPQRGDAVEKWLTTKRDTQKDPFGTTPGWYAYNTAILDYQAHADCALSLDQPLPPSILLDADGTL